jgi:hypothetical protein
MAHSAGDGLLVIERILRDRDGVWRQIIEERGLGQLTVRMLTSSVLSLAVFGAVIGSSYGWQQALSSLIKLPLLFLATLAICLPTLYLFNLVFGARLTVLQAVTLIMVCITVTSVLTLAFAPISLFFLITAQSYSFYKLLNVGILLLTALVGLRFLTAGMKALNDHQQLTGPEPAGRQAGGYAAPTLPPHPYGAPVPNGGSVPVGVPQATGPAPAPAAVGAAAGSPVTVAAPPNRPLDPAGEPAAQWPVGALGRPAPVMVAQVHRPAPVPERPASMSLLYIWMLLFGFVGTQLAWTLRPFFGSHGEPFGLFRHVGGTFYGDVISTIGRLLGAG